MNMSTLFYYRTGLCCAGGADRAVQQQCECLLLHFGLDFDNGLGQSDPSVRDNERARRVLNKRARRPFICGRHRNVGHSTGGLCCFEIGNMARVTQGLRSYCKNAFVSCAYLFSPLD